MKQTSPVLILKKFGTQVALHLHEIWKVDHEIQKCDQILCAHTVTLKYNFIITPMDTHDDMQYFACQMSKFPVEICISMRRNVALPQDKVWYLHGS